MKAATILASLALAGSAVAGPLRRDRQCNDYNMKVRKDWDAMCAEDRIAYTNAVKCIYEQPSNLDNSIYPAALNRFLDYAVIHAGRGLNIHLSGFFLTWHRYYVDLWYQDLQHTCGYKGPMPYWNWPATVFNLNTSGVFDGSATSMGSDGVYVDSGPIPLSDTLSIPHGSGGGCIKSGPFSDFTITLDPIPISVALQGGPLPANWAARHDQCILRDLNTFVGTTFLNQSDVDAAIATPDFAVFSELVDGSIPKSELGLHSGAHFTVGGTTANIFASPQDPIWYLMHAYLDKIYTEWQDAHPEGANSILGTETFGNNPPTANVTLDTYEPDWGYFHGSVQVKDLISTTAGPFCYRYE